MSREESHQGSTGTDDRKVVRIEEGKAIGVKPIVVVTAEAAPALPNVPSGSTPQSANGASAANASPSEGRPSEAPKQ